VANSESVVEEPHCTWVIRVGAEPMLAVLLLQQSIEALLIMLARGALLHPR
jgi:hypothetical protein